MVHLTARLNSQYVHRLIFAIQFVYDPPPSDPGFPDVLLSLECLRKAWIVGVGGQLFDPSDHTSFGVPVQALNVISGSA